MNFLKLKIPPIIVTALTAFVLWIGKEVFPSLTFNFPFQIMVACSFAFAGGCISLSGVFHFRKSKTSVHPMKFDHVNALVDSGVYSYTRNPMYLGLLFILVGWFYFLSNLASACLVPAFILYMNYFQIQPEEMVLESKFFEAFTRYKTKVRRWL